MKNNLKKSLIAQGLASSELEAEKLILSGRVRQNGEKIHTPNQKISNDAVLSLDSDRKYFSRAGEKLDFALASFSVDVTQKVCADVGASTGGFTGVLLSKGAKKVYAIDVARGEIAWKLRNDPAVILMERTNARDLRELPEKIEIVTIDVSFISVSLILPNVQRWLSDSGKIVVLVKPQFEAPRELVEAGGVIRDKATHALVLEKFRESVSENRFVLNNLCASPILGAEGNREFLALLGRGGEAISKSVIQSLAAG